MICPRMTKSRTYLAACNELPLVARGFHDNLLPLVQVNITGTPVQIILIRNEPDTKFAGY